MAFRYDVLFVIEVVEIDNITGDVVPDSREEIHDDLIKSVSSEESAYSIIDALTELKETTEKVYSWLNKE